MNSRRFICRSRAGERYEGSIARPKRVVLTPGACPGPGPAGKGGWRLMGAVFAQASTPACPPASDASMPCRAGDQRKELSAMEAGELLGCLPAPQNVPKLLHPAVLYVHVICDMSPLLTRDRLT